MVMQCEQLYIDEYCSSRTLVMQHPASLMARGDSDTGRHENYRHMVMHS